MNANNALDAEIVAVMGATGSGKSMYVKGERIKKSDRRLAVWDYKREYQDYGTVTERLGDAVRMMGQKEFKVIFRPSFDDKIRAQQFDVFCRAVWHARNVKCVVEELSMVTTPQRAPAGWKMLTCTGRGQGISIIGLSQRPAQVDKDFFDNCTELRTGTLAGKRSIQVMADELGVTEDDIRGLQPLQFIHKNLRTKKIFTGTVKIVRTA